MTSLELALNKLAKWRSVFASWQLGTRLAVDGESRAVRDHREATIILRAEHSALISLLLRKGVFSEQEWQDQLEESALDLDATYEKQFDGFSTDQDGVHMNVARMAKTMERMGFPP